jgi:hypothetical protein
MSARIPAGVSELAPAGTGSPWFWRVAVALLALVGAASVLLSTSKYGAGITSLSSSYLDAASSLAKGSGFVFHTGAPMVLWPPLYSLLLALVASVTGLEPAVFAHVVNALLFVLVLVLSARLFRTAFGHDVAYGLLGVCSVLFSVPLSGVYATAWSECLFIPLTLLYLVFAQRYWNRSDNLSLAVMTAAAALACLTRYIGVSLALAGVATIILNPSAGLRGRLARALAFASLSLAPLGAWCLRNQLLTGKVTGQRGPVTVPVAASVIDALRVMLSWCTFGLGSELAVLAWVVVLAVAVLSSGSPGARLSGSLKGLLSGRFPLLAFLVAYLGLLLVTSGATPLDRIDNRLLSPVYVPASLVMLEFGLRLFGPGQRRSAALVRATPAFFLALWLCFPMASVASSTAGRMRNGAGSFNSDIWRKSETVAYVKQMLNDGGPVPVYSNGADALWELARIDARELPLRSVSRLSDLRGHWPAETPSVIVRFDRCWLRGYHSIEELGSIADVSEIARFNDGSVYRASVRDETSAAGR